MSFSTLRFHALDPLALGWDTAFPFCRTPSTFFLHPPSSIATIATSLTTSLTAKESCCITNYLQLPTLNSPPPTCDNSDNADCSSGDGVRTAHALALHQRNLPLTQPPRPTANQPIRCCMLERPVLPHLLRLKRSLLPLLTRRCAHSSSSGMFCGRSST